MRGDDEAEGRPEDRTEKKRRSILEVARTHFMQHGYADSGMEAIARESGVSTATLYNLFPSKRRLFEAVIEESGEVFSRRILQVSSVETDDLGRLRLFARGYASFLCEPFVRSVFYLVLAERRRFRTTARGFYLMGRESYGGTLLEILTALQQGGKLNAPRLSTATGQLMGMIEHPCFVVPMLSGGEVEPIRTPDQIADDAIDTFLSRYGVA